MDELQRDYDDFVGQALCGYLTLNPDGFILEANPRLAIWMACDTADLPGKRFSDLLSIGGRIYYETHLAPLLRLQGFFDEVALELYNKKQERIPVLVNGYERRAANSEPVFIRLTVFKATERRQYEQNLVNEKKAAENELNNEKTVSALREQFIAVLGHDLRNPLSSVLTGSSLLRLMAETDEVRKIAATVENSGKRMAGMIGDIMDFARGRLGAGMQLTLVPTHTATALQHVVDELQATFPDRIIETHFDITEPVNCDLPRLSQLLSNLLGNALIHGAPDIAVRVEGFHRDGYFTLSVRNGGKAISAAALDKLFHPFYREGERPHQNGLGLGLYIASQIALAHQGELSVLSDNNETIFTFIMSHPAPHK